MKTIRKTPRNIAIRSKIKILYFHNLKIVLARILAVIRLRIPVPMLKLVDQASIARSTTRIRAVKPNRLYSLHQRARMIISIIRIRGD